MKIVFEMNDDTFRDIDCLILSQDSTKAYYFDEIMENCIPLSKVLDEMRAEIEVLPKTYPFINHIDTYVKEDDVKKIIDKYKNERKGMSEISETEIKSMTKEQNYMRGYKNGKYDMLNKIRSEVIAISINGQVDEHTMFIRTGEQVKQMALGIIDKYKAESEG